MITFDKVYVIYDLMILQVLGIEGWACYHVYKPLTLLTIPYCQHEHEVTEYNLDYKMS